MRLMIIGASGFLGSHVRRQAESAGLEIATAGRSGSRWHLDLAADDPAQIAATLAAAAPDVVVNCAGAVAGGTDRQGEVNVTGAYALVTGMLQADLPARLVHLGSAAEYGPGEPGVPVTESAPPRPASVYGVTKLAGTRLVQLARTAGLPAVVLRVFNPVGPGMSQDSLPGKLVAELRRSRADGAVIRLGPLDAVRDFVDARDVADAVVAAATCPQLSHPVLNIGSGLGVQVRTLVKELLAVSGSDATIREDAPAPERSADTSWQQADISCASRDLDWQPRRELSISLADLWAEAR
jgi:NDP-hexose 4-ketoreductase